MYRKPFALGVILLFLLSSLIPMVSSDTPTLNKTTYVDDDGGVEYTKIQDAIDNVRNIRYETNFCYLFIGFIYNLKTLKWNDSEIIYVFNCFSVLVIGWKEGDGISVEYLNKGESWVFSDSNYPNYKSHIIGYVGERFICGIMYGGCND